MASSTTMPKSRGAWKLVRRELVRTVTRTPKKVLAKMTGRPWPPVHENDWNSNDFGAYRVPRYQHSLRPTDVESLVGKPDPLILEIGANDGEDSHKFLNHFGRMKLFCFEPDARAIAKFKKRIDDARCRLIEKAVATRSGSTLFWQSGGGFDPQNSDWDKSGSIHPPTGHLQMVREVTFGNVIEVPTVSLDDWTAEHPEIGAIDLLWMDVQGAEHDVFAGAAKTLPMVRFLYSEFYQRPMYEGQKNLDDLLSMLPGFTLLAIYQGCNFLARNDLHK